MTGIPSDIAASSLQAGYQAREAAKDRDGHKVGQAAAATRQMRAVDESAATVETQDEDAQVYADAEGTGSQGRHLEDQESEESHSAGDADGASDGQEHRLDIQA